MANISSIGVGSNLPLNDLLNNLRRTENVSLERIIVQKKQAEARVSAYGVLKGSLENLAEAFKALSSHDAFSAAKIAVGGDAFTAVGKSGAMSGRYDITVSQLACSQVLAARHGQTSRTEQIGGKDAGGVMTFQVGSETKTLDLAGKGNSLDDIVKAINASDLGVQATVLNDGGATPHRLMLTTTASGKDAEITSISVAGNDDLQAVLGYGGSRGGMQENVAARDAEATINGIAITSASNTIDNVIDGVSLTLNKLTSAPQTLTVETDLEPTKAAIKKFVEEYNALQTHIGNLTRYNQETKQGSALTGDSTARAIQSRARGIIDASVSDNLYANLSKIGITTNPDDGKLQINDSKLEAALKDNSDAVAKLFVGENGIAARADAIIKPILESQRGLLTTSIEGAKKSVSTLDKEYEHTELRIEATMERYRAQFTALDGMVSQMNGISAYLTQQLGMLAATSHK